MARYEHPDIRFDAPLDWDERTVVSFSAPARPDRKIAPNVVLTRDPAEQGVSLDAFAEKQLVEISKRLRGFELVDRRSTTVGGTPGIELRFRQKSPLGPLEQRLVLFANKGTVFTLTTTVGADEAAEQDPIFDRILGTFDLSTAGAPSFRPGGR